MSQGVHQVLALLVQHCCSEWLLRREQTKREVAV